MSSALPPASPFDLLNKYADAFDLKPVARMVRLAAPGSPLHGARFRYSDRGDWALTPRPGVSSEAAARELCVLLGLIK